MTQKLLILLMIVSLWACNSQPEIEKAGQELKKIQKKFKNVTAEDLAADKRMMDMTIPDMTPKAIRIPKELADHPLARLSEPEDVQIIRYLKIHDMEGTCYSDKKDSHDYRICAELIKEAMKKCSDAGISTTEADFRNRAFIEHEKKLLVKHRHVKSRMTRKESMEYSGRCSERLEKFKNGEKI